MKSGQAEVLVVGAGPVGLFAALCLARRGVSVRVLDRNDATKRDPRAAVVWPRAAEALRAEGVAELFRAASAPLRAADIFIRGRLRGAVKLGNLASPEPLPWIIEQHHTEALLRDALRGHGVEVEWDTVVDQVENAAGAAHVRLTRHGEVRTLESAWVVGCDGSRSRVRKSLGIAFEGRPREHIECIQVDAVPRWEHADTPGHCRFFLEEQGTLLAVPLPTGGCRFVSFIRTHAPASPDPVTLEEVRALYAQLAHAKELQLELTQPTWLSRARFQDRVAATLRQGNVLLAGDAAHVWTPIGGRGMNVGLLGAQNLAWKLAAHLRGGAPVSLLDSYSQEQRRVARSSIQGLWMNRTEYPSAPWMLELVDTAMPLAASWAPLWRFIETDLSGLRMHHRGSELTRAAADGGGVQAGHRLPYAPVPWEGGEAMSHALIDRERWTLFQVALSEDERRESAAALEGVQGRVVVREVPASAGLGKRHRLILVRPDSHVAWTAPARDVGRVVQFVAGGPR